VDIGALWKSRGIHLRDAPDQLAPARPITSALSPNQGSELTGGWKSLADVKGWDHDQRQSVKKGLDAIQTVADAALAAGHRNYQRARYVADLVIAKKALAVGFSTGATEPVIIPPYLFENEGFIKWSKNEIAGNGLRFISVKIIKLRRSEVLPQNTGTGIQKGRAKAGRPSSAELEGIIRELNSDPEFSRKPGKTQVTEIRKRAMEKYPAKFKNGRGLSAPTIYRFMRMVSAS
jgi:hypothetical protein